MCCCYCCSVAKSCPTLCDLTDCSTPGFPVLHHLLELLKLMSIESVMPFNHLILCRPLLLLPSFFPSSESFQMSQFFKSGGQSIGASASTSVLPMNIQGWFPLDWLVWSPCSPRDSQEFSPTPQFKSINSSALSFFYSPILQHPYMTTGKTIALTTWTFAEKVMSLLFNKLGLP